MKRKYQENFKNSRSETNITSKFTEPIYKYVTVKTRVIRNPVKTDLFYSKPGSVGRCLVHFFLTTKPMVGGMW